jgi:anaerobic selenocysteine-containing dehydrogenase
MIGKVKGGELLKLEGNPYSHNTYDYVIPKGAKAKPGDLDLGGKDIGSLCPKGQSGVYTLYNPRRLLHPVKRVGPRGSRKWKRITWDQAYDEIVNGGNLFGEGHVDGLAAIRSDEPIGSAESDYMDEAPPDGYGPKKNQFYWMRGRNENKLSTNRFHQNYGTISKGTHWTICEASEVHFMAILTGGPFGAWDLKEATYAISAGSNVYDASFPAQTQARHLAKWFLRRPETKYVYLGPRMNKAASLGGEWIPIKTETDPDFGLGMIRYIIENNLYKADMIARPNPDAAAAGGYPTSTDFTYLVKTDHPKEYLRDADGDILVSVGGVLTKAKDVTGTADLEASVPGAKTVFTMLKERAFELTMDQYNDNCGIPRGTIERITREFANAEKPVIFQYKGPCQQSNARGVQAYNIVNLMMDRYYRPGGFSGGGGAPHGGVDSPVKVERKGVVASRASDVYAGAKPKPTKPWFPLNPSKGGDGVQQEWAPGVATGYPYKIKALMGYRTDFVYTLARAQPARKLMDVVPLIFVVDPFMNETSMLADYVLPDTTYMEHFGYMHTHSLVKHYEGVVRQPLVGTVDHSARKYTPINPDTKTPDQIHIDLGLKLGLPNIGKNGAGEGHDIFTDYDLWDLHYDHGDFHGGLNPDADHMKIGGIFGSSLDRPDLKTGKHMPAYIEKIAQTKNSLSGEYMDGLPFVQRMRLGDGRSAADVIDLGAFNYELGTNKRMQHTQGRTAENLWIMSLEPENGLEMNPEDAARFGVKTGDWVELENWSGDKGRYKVIVTNTIRPGYGEVTNSYGHWEHGSKDIEIEGHEGGGIKGDARVGAGFNITYLMAHDLAQSGDPETIGPLSDEVGGSSKQYGYPVKMRKV